MALKAVSNGIRQKEHDQEANDRYIQKHRLLKVTLECLRKLEINAQPTH